MNPCPFHLWNFRSRLFDWMMKDEASRWPVFKRFQDKWALYIKQNVPLAYLVEIRLAGIGGICKNTRLGLKQAFRSQERKTKWGRDIINAIDCKEIYGKNYSPFDDPPEYHQSFA